MREVRIFSPRPLATGTTVQLDDTAARHVGQVLRMQPGQPLTLFDGSGGEYAATIVAATRNALGVQVGELRAVERESPVQVTLWHGLCRNERMDAVIQKATELGVTAIRPLLTGRSIVKLDAQRAARKLAHWQQVAISACEQCGRNRLPEILAPAPFAQLLHEVPGYACAVILDPSAAVALGPAVAGCSRVLVCTGPEGGFTDEELSAATAAGCKAVRAGPRVLRTETAPLVAITIIQQVGGDLGN